MKDRESILTSQKIVERKKKKRNRVSVVAAGIILVVIILPPILARLPWIAIKVIRVAGANTIDAQAVQDMVAGELAQTRWKVFPRGTFVTYDNEGLAADIMHAFPAASAVSLALSVPNTLTVSMSERQPFSLWCNDAKECFFADELGFLYERAPTFSTAPFLMFKNGVANASDATPNWPIGARISDADSFAKAKDLAARFSALGLSTKEIVFNENGTLTFALARGELYVSLRQDAALTEGNLATLLKDQKKNLSDGAGGLSVSYIDLRFGNKIFYK